MKICNAGIVGFGLIREGHSYVNEYMKYYYPDAPFRAKLFGVCTSKEKTAKKAKEKYGIEFTTTDYKEPIENPDIEIVDISSHNIYHYQQLVCLIRNKKNLYCEKPIVSTIEEVIQLENQLTKFDKVHQITFHNRFIPATIKTKQLIDNGFLGQPTIFRISYYHSGNLEREKPIGWKQEKGAGVLLDLGSHIIDLIYWFLGGFDCVMAKVI